MTIDDDNRSEQAVAEQPLFGIPGLPTRVLETYARLWQFETWMRELVYVQLRAKAGDAWDGYVQRASRPKTNDKRLTHMPTAEENLLSYAQLSELRGIIADNWSMFEAYLPPQSLWDAKLDEVSQIRHRIAHFRSTHADDLARVVQLLRDIDAGMWRFCTSYNNPQPVLPPDQDPVVAAFQHFDFFPWTDVGNDRWARVGHAHPDERILLQVEVLAMPWATWALPIAGKEGFLYNVLVYARGRNNHDYKRLLERTQALHKHVAHLCLGGDQKSFRLTVPAALGTDLVSKLIAAFHDAAMNALRPGLDMLADDRVQQLADSLPEYVLGPSHPLTFLTPEMPCSVFGV